MNNEMDNVLREAFELILNSSIIDKKGKVYHHFYWADGFAWDILDILKKHNIEKISNGIIEPDEDGEIMDIYYRHPIDFGNSFIALEKYCFSEFGQEVVDAVLEGTVEIGDTFYLKGSALIEIIERFDIDIEYIKDFQSATIVAKMHTDGTLFGALCSLFCTTIEYEELMSWDDSVENLDEEWKGIFGNIPEPLKSKLACFFMDEETARSDGGFCYNAINNGELFSEFVQNPNNKCIIQLFFGVSQASSFILEVNEEIC